MPLFEYVFGARKRTDRTPPRRNKDLKKSESTGNEKRGRGARIKVTKLSGGPRTAFDTINSLEADLFNDLIIRLTFKMQTLVLFHAGWLAGLAGTREPCGGPWPAGVDLRTNEEDDWKPFVWLRCGPAGKKEYPPAMVEFF